MKDQSSGASQEASCSGYDPPSPSHSSLSFVSGKVCVSEKVCLKLAVYTSI